MEFTPPFGQWLKTQRARLDLTQGDLARRVGYSPETIRKIEAGALRPSKQIVDLLADHLGVPSAQRDAFLAFATEARVKDAQPALGNLPVQLTPFIGRANDVAEVKRLLGATRLLTLTGSGGVGKTRLAQEVAGRMASACRDGAWLVELAPLSNPELIADAITVAFGLRPTSQPARILLIEHLRDRHTLLILDNCEHLIGACARLAEALLRACPRLCILATSREPLNVPGETTWRVPSLATGDAVQLFAHRARAAKPAFQLTNQNRDALNQICERLDNIPLAIELAASRLRAFSVEQIAAKLDDRFHLLSGGSRTALPRHQTLRALIDWSYGLLSSNEQRLLRRLSVFAGGWTLEMGEAMHGNRDAVDVVAELVNKSLVVVDENASEPRYAMLETIRQYGQDKLVEAGELEQAHEQHLSFCINLLQKAKPHLHGPDQVVWLDRLEVEIDNLRTALAWVVQTSDSRHSERMLDGIWWMWYERGYYAEGLRWIDDLLINRSAEGDLVHLIALVASGWLSTRKGNFSQANDAFAQAESTARKLADPYWIVWANIGIGFVAKDYEEATRALDEAIQRARTHHLNWEEIEAMAHLGVRSRIHGDSQKAEQLLTETLAKFREIGDAAQASWVLLHLGQLKFKQGNRVEARQMLEESVALARRLKFPIRIAYALVEQATVALHQHDVTQATEAVQECTTIYYSIGNFDRIGQCLSIVAGNAHHSSKDQHAALLLGAADHLWLQYGSHGTYYQDIHAEYDRQLFLVRAAMAPAEFERAFAEGQAMSLQQAMDAAMAL